MLPARLRIALLFAAALAGICVVRTQAQDGNKLKALIQDRLATAVELEKVATVRFMNGQGSVQELMDARRIAFEAELEASTTAKARMAALEKYQAKMKEAESLAKARFEAGQAPQALLLTAKAERLRIEIAIEKAKMAKAPKAAGEAKGQAYQATIKAHESVRVFAQVSGTLKKQTLDIGDRVQRGQMLAVLDVPTLEASLKHGRAVLDLAKARMLESRAKLVAANAEVEAAKAGIGQAEAKAKTAEANTRLHAAQLERMKKLFADRVTDQKTVDEAKGKFEVAEQTERAAKAQWAMVKADLVAVQARLDQVKADLVAREAGINVAAASLEKLNVQQSFANVTAPFDGIITQRGYQVGDFIRSAENRGNDPAVFTIQRTDHLRVLVPIPERDVPFITPGMAADVEIDAFPKKTWASKIARVAGVIDRKTGTMLVEIEIPNPAGNIIPGMTGRATIHLERR
ncbi:MAG TPA: efflux RND transporter periplasmic adaptor subunit [Gemmataceae bacterium]|nr:efflux RND transporter periplasmic adaptor subunit [Gemmataceae bacterium]